MYRPQLSILQTFTPKTHLPLSRDRVWLIEQGIVRTFTWSDRGYLTILGIWGQGDIVGLPLSPMTPYQVECLTPVAVAEVPLGSQSRYWQELLLNHLWRSQELFHILHNPQMTDRLLALLHWLAQRFGQSTPQGLLLDAILTHHQLAETLGSSRVTVTRLLSRLEQQGKIIRFRRQVAYGVTPRTHRALLLPAATEERRSVGT
ncbi:MAG: Crp/Fnr family transcriptional regulator [Leptolyngbya sp. LCM1.Bin17]|nr:MAG: Crp/Fnr family transcriptional regulator [Leptolyngbya sp. LCM1.Bin17]